MKIFCHKQENGVALLFALGLLALLSVLGTAFVANALTAQKISANTNARNHAHILLDSAVARVMTGVMSILKQENSFTDFSQVRSYTASGDNDMLNVTGGTSLLTVHMPGLPTYDGNTSSAVWVPVRNADDELIGRIAYQVLPTGRSSMSLDHVLRGVYTRNDTLPAAGTALAAWNHRIGNSIREFNIGKANGNGTFKSEWLLSGITDPPVIPIVSGFNDFFGSDLSNMILAKDVANETTDNQRKIWLRHWFSESEKAAPEVFYYAARTTALEKANAYHRFNLGRITGTTPKDAWYSRFKDFDSLKDNADIYSFKNSRTVLDLLTQSAEKFYPEDKAAPPGSGLPFLRTIADNSGSFASTENRRLQIAANLNDYCDTDSIPTSDIAAKTWNKDKRPTYTGNEKTPYINEIALGLEVTPVLANTTVPAQNSTPAFSGDLEINITALPSLFAELINIYQGTPADTTFKATVKDVKFKVTAKVKGDISYRDKDGNSKHISIDETTVAGDFVHNSTNTEADIERNFPGSGYSSGYQIQKIALPLNISGKLSLVNAFKAAADADVDFTTGATDITAKVTNVTLTISHVSFKFNYAALYCQLPDVSGALVPTGVDYVKGLPADEITSSITAGSVDTVMFEGMKITGKDLTPVPGAAEELSPGWKHIYLAGIEARDPRQNLNFNKVVWNVGEQKLSDWKCAPKLVNVPFSNNYDVNNSFNVSITVAGGAAAAWNYSGRVNTCSFPNAPTDYTKGSIGMENFDNETAADPAWIGLAHGTHVSTAFIRNAPMESLWELGAIHRGTAWETINLKNALNKDGSRIHFSDHNPAARPWNNTDGIPFINGDGGLLDQVKLTSEAYSSGKLDVNMLLAPGTDYPAEWDDNIAKALLHKIRYGQELADIDSVSATGISIEWDSIPAAAITAIKIKPAGIPAPNAERYVCRGAFLEGVDNNSFPANAFGIISNWNDLPDAQREEVVGKIANILTAGATPPTTIQAVVTVQTIKSLPDGLTNIARTAYLKNGTPENVTLAAATAGIDKTTLSDGSVYYFDEITGEIKALVTILRETDTDDGGIRLRVYNVKYLGY